VAIVTKTFADDVMRIPQISNAIRGLPGGDEFLWYYHKCSMIADIAYLSPFAFKFFKGFAIGAYNLSKRGYETVTAFTENGWVKLKDYYAKVKQTLAKGGVVVEELAAVGVGKAALLNKLISNPNVSGFVSRLDDVTDAELIQKIDEIVTNDATRLANLEELYNPSTFSLPADRPFINGIDGLKVGGDFTCTKTIDGSIVSVYYNKSGYPNFKNVSAGDEYIFNSNTLTGLSNDMTVANNTMRQKFINEPDKFKWNGSTTWFEIKDASGTWVKQTWHHYQNGRTMFPVPSKIHNAVEGGFNHTGGKAIITRNLQDIFK
jgi:DNase/tRNase domain of colicin-like bacteriocin